MLKQRALSSIGVVAVGVIPALLGSPVFSITIAIIAIGALYELYRAFQRVGARPSTWSGTAAVIALIVIAGTDAPFRALTAAMVGYTLIALAQHLMKTDITGSLLDWAFSLCGVMYVGVTLMHFVLIRRIQGNADAQWITDADNVIGDGGAALGLAWLLFALFVTWLTDVPAYLVGRAIGKRKLIPNVSPGKTVEGAIAGLLGGSLTGALAGWILGVPEPIWVLALVGMVLSVGAMIGDLGESLIKRNIGIKDMGGLIPGHGGILDRIDALLVTIPVTFYIAILLQQAS